MYSVVLAMALAGSAEAPDCHGCQNNCGCQGVVSTGCFGGCIGRTGCYGGCVGNRVGCLGGCLGNRVGCQGGYVGCQGGVIVVPAGTAQPMPKPETVPDPKKKLVTGPTPATIVVSLPADAKLSIDGYVSTQTSSQRVLVTPPLQPGQEFSYTLVAESNSNGQTVSQQQVISVRAGHQTPVSFNFNAAPTSTGR